ncbi:hypothetical protein C8R41DRAFT_870814 [Lentinula lateritia]|uniref:UBX domain-containing protein n=1 Tax=Lentinula lateritia TaxID=40482 RepID=A0ABQ8V4G8_9AGAR|nr:hypothetical protein C8R41DRAFT_870814 [Lentinula lateritia]
MASTSSQTQAAASTTLLPTSLMEAQGDYSPLRSILRIPRISMELLPFQPFRILVLCPNGHADVTKWDEDSIETDPMELYHLFEDAAPYLLMQQWGIPPNIGLLLRKRTDAYGSSEDLDVFASLRGKGSPGTSKAVSPPKVSDIVSSPPATKAQTVPPRALRRNREIESLKVDASSFRGRHYLEPLHLPRFRGKKEPKSKTTVK